MECFPWVRFILFGPPLGLVTYLFVLGGKLHTLERFWDRTLAPFVLGAIEKVFFLVIGALGLFVSWHVLKWLARYALTHRIISKDEWRGLHRKLTTATERVEALTAEREKLVNVQGALITTLNETNAKLEKATVPAAAVAEAAFAQITTEAQ